MLKITQKEKLHEKNKFREHTAQCLEIRDFSLETNEKNK